MAKKIILIISFSCLLIWLGYFTPRQDFVQLFSLYSVLFILYFFLLREIKNSYEIILTGVFFRLVLLFSIPGLSDDFYRFIWDGRILINGLNPYTILPAEFIQSPDFQRVIGDKSIFNNLNSPNYFTVYPPLNQFIFGISAWLSQGSIWWNVLWLRVFIIATEIGTLYLIRKIISNLGKSDNKALEGSLKNTLGLYAFNPLIILELTGNVHFEAEVIFFLLLAYTTSVFSNRLIVTIVVSAILFACAVSMKLLPLIFIPLVIKQLGIRKGLLYASIVGFVTLSFFIPFVDKMLVDRILSSVSLYFQKFEFNASIYYLVRAIGFKIFGFNIISSAGTSLALFSFLGILIISWRNKNFTLSALGIITLYFMLATTVHPWYASTLIAITIFTRFRYPIVWSYLIFLSYATYQTKLYQENLWFVALEYLVVFGIMIYELKTYSKSSE